MKTLPLLLVLATPATAQEVPPLSDSDGDGLPAGVEWALTTDPRRVDTDRDGVPDGVEYCTPGGRPTDPTVTLEGAGMRVSFWREGAEAWVVAVYRGATAPLTVRALIGDQVVDLTPMARELVRVPSGVVAAVVGFPADTLPAVGGRLLVVARAGSLEGQATALIRSGGWHSLQMLEGGIARSLWAERRVVNPAPPPATLQTHPKACGQKLTRMGVIPGAPEYSRYMVTLEDCIILDPRCVDDCGTLIGYTMVWLTNPRR